MAIFDKTKTVIGLFENDKEVEQAIKALQERGFGTSDQDEINIIDQNRLPQESPMKEGGPGLAVPSTETNNPPIPAVVTPTETPETEATAVERGTEQALTDLNVGREEAFFYARQVARGNALVIVETNEERAPEALDIMKQTIAKVKIF